MATYAVEVIRTEKYKTTLTVEAESPEQAGAAALKQARKLDTEEMTPLDSHTSAGPAKLQP